MDTERIEQVIQWLRDQANDGPSGFERDRAAAALELMDLLSGDGGTYAMQVNALRDTQETIARFNRYYGEISQWK